MKKLKCFSHDYFNKGRDIDAQFNDWIEKNPENDVVQITASESTNEHGRYLRTLYVLYKESLLP